MKSFNSYVVENATPYEDVRGWIHENTESFKEHHSEEWQPALYASALELFAEDIDLYEAYFGQEIVDWLKRNLFGNEYKAALLDLAKALKGKYVGKSVEFTAAQIAKQYENVDSRNLAELFLMATNESLIEDTAAPTSTTAGVASPDAKPLFKSRKVAGVLCVEVDSDTYMKCRFGKKKYSRWSGVVEDEGLRDFVKKNYSKEKQMLVMNKDTGSATFIKR